MVHPAGGSLSVLSLLRLRGRRHLFYPPQGLLEGAEDGRDSRIRPIVISAGGIVPEASGNLSVYKPSSHLQLHSWADHMAGRVASAREDLSPVHCNRRLHIEPLFFLGAIGCDADYGADSWQAQDGAL